MKTYAVKARLFKGKKSYDENGELMSVSQTIDLPIYGSLEWKNYIANVKNLGYSELKVISTKEITHKDSIPSHKDVETPSDILAELKEAFVTRVERVLTPEQKKIAELEAKLDAVLSGSKTNDNKEDDTNTLVGLEEAREEYKNVFGEAPHHLMKEEGIRKAINNK